MLVMCTLQSWWKCIFKTTKACSQSIIQDQFTHQQTKSHQKTLNMFKKLHLKSKLSMFRAPSQNYQHHTEKKKTATWSKLSEKLKGIEISVSQVVLELLIKTWSFVLINNSRNTWPIEFLMPFLSVSDNLLQDAYKIKHAQVWLRWHSPLMWNLRQTYQKGETIYYHFPSLALSHSWKIVQDLEGKPVCMIHLKLRISTLRDHAYFC